MGVMRMFILWRRGGDDDGEEIRQQQHIYVFAQIRRYI
jgi:hypothetical protein